MEIHNTAAWYFAVINAVAIIAYGVPELTLLGIAAIGGSIGALVAMKLFHHKTLHLKFKYGVPLILALQVAGLVYLHMPR